MQEMQNVPQDSGTSKKFLMPNPHNVQDAEDMIMNAPMGTQNANLDPGSLGQPNSNHIQHLPSSTDRTPKEYLSDGPMGAKNRALDQAQDYVFGK